ncbi:hypothetical protein RZS08_34205, partial [Arthrospira platensis SPKY1]|nr:hypothetical protein [Arthrospira platensis SPKY1]
DNKSSKKITGNAAWPTSRDSSSIKVAVYATSEVQAALGGINQVNTLIASSIAASNTAFANSQVDIVFELVHSGVVDYNESTFEIDLQRLQAPSDGQLDEIIAAREEHKADLVSLLV